MSITAERKPSERAEQPASLLSDFSAPVAPPKQRRTRRLVWLGLIVLASSVAIWRNQGNGKITYDTLAVESGSVQASITATGTLNPVVSVQVGSQVSGNIKGLYADFNTKVKKGQLVALVDPQILQAQVEQAESAASAAKSAVVAARAQVTKGRADLAGAIANRANLQSIASKDRVNALNAQTQWRRSEQLFRAGVVPQQDRDTARAAYDASRAQVVADEAQIDAAEHSIQSSRAQSQVAQTQLSAAEAQQAAQDEAKALLRQRHHLQLADDDDFSIRNMTEVFAAQEASSRVMSVMLAAVASVSLVVGGIGIMNIMLVSVRERTREIGLRRAVGAKIRDILVQFLAEATVLSIVGGLIGVIIGVCTSFVISQLAGWNTVVGPSAVLLALLFSALIGIGFGYYPARQAAYLDPIEALRFE